MTVAFEGDAHVHYGFLWFDALGGSGYETELMDARAGQTNGLLGGVEPGVLSMVTGMHTGLVALRVEVLDAAPEGLGEWDEVVEASVDVRDTDVSLSAFEWGTTFSLPTPGWYRARWSDAGMDAGRETERYEPDEPVVERCLLQLWPAPPAADAILRETSPTATYWHREARDARPGPTPHERALTEERRRVERAEQERRWEREYELEQWGGRDPSPRLRDAVGTAFGLVRERRDLVDDLERLAPATQRALALELTAQICTEAYDAPVDWGPAVAALRRGDPLPPPFDERLGATRAVYGITQDPQWSVSLVVRAGPPPPRQPSEPKAAALAAVFAAAAPDPFTAVLGVVEAVSGSAPDLDTWFAEVGRRVRALSGPSS